jgi:hypothetical protein
MNIYNNFKPTYLYIKQHTITGLKYFGKTTKTDPYTYTGSGKYWMKHIKKHGKEHIETVWVALFHDMKECNEYAVKFSTDNDIAKSPLWANQMIEDGMTGAGSPGRIISENQREKHRQAAKAAMDKGLNRFSDPEFHRENARKQIEAGTHPVFNLHEPWVCTHCGKTGKGKGQFSQHTKSEKCKNFDKPKITTKDVVNRGTHDFLGPDLQRKRVANGTHPSQLVWTCEHCFKVGKGKGVFTRFHGSNCRSKK